MIPDHAFDVQVLEKDYTVHTHKCVAELMRKVITSKLDALMDAARYLTSLLSLCSGQSFLIRAKEARIINLLTRRKSAERVEANVNPNSLINLWC